MRSGRGAAGALVVEAAAGALRVAGDAVTNQRRDENENQS